jgi:hypothetical protein
MRGISVIPPSGRINVEAINSSWGMGGTDDVRPLRDVEVDVPGRAKAMTDAMKRALDQHNDGKLLDASYSHGRVLNEARVSTMEGMIDRRLPNEKTD